MPVKIPVRAILLGVVAAAAVGMSAALVWLPRAGWSTNDVTTGASVDYPDLLSHVYDMPPDQTLQVTAAVATRLPNWTVKETDLASGVLRAEAKTPLGLFTDDVTVSAVAEGSYTKVIIRSHSRVGKADLGVNARNIRALQAAMDRQLNRVS